MHIVIGRAHIQQVSLFNVHGLGLLGLDLRLFHQKLFILGARELVVLVLVFHLVVSSVLEIACDESEED